MPDNNLTHIILEFSDGLDNNLQSNLAGGLDNDKLDFRVIEKPNKPYAALEWAIPGLIAAYILKPYFESFLQEAGKDHYRILKNWIKKNASLSRLLKVSKITSSHSSEKLDNKDSQSMAFSVFIQLSDNRMLKLLFDTNLENDIWEENIDEIFDLVLENYVVEANDQLTSLLIDIKYKDKDTIYAIIDPKTRKWTFWDKKSLINKNRDKKIGS